MVLGPLQFKIRRRWRSLGLHPKSVHNYQIRKTKEEEEEEEAEGGGGVEGAEEEEEEEEGKG
jgi:hypothetical protein